MGNVVITRRDFIKGAVALGGLMAAGGFWRAFDTGVFQAGSGPAYEAWGKNVTGIDGLVNSAILATNAHNTQPWHFKIDNHSIDIFADKTRNIGTADPYFRELYISIGCSLENLILAAKVNGYSPNVTLLPNPTNDSHVAHIELTKTQPVSSPLYDVIPNRRMNRAPYEKDRAVSKEILQSMVNLNENSSEIKVFMFDSATDKQKVGKAMIEATEAFIGDPDQVRDDTKWMRQSWDTIKEKKDGITLDAQGLPGWMLTVAKMLPPMSPEQNNKYWISNVRDKQIPTSAAFGFIAVQDLNSKQQVVQAGQLWQRIHLFGTTKGLGMHILNQLSERRDRELSQGIEPVFGKKLHEILGDSKWNSVIQFRLGYPTAEPHHSPRRPVSEVLI
ncbi:MAG TPA: hypothetical protein DDY49_04060 [Paenibacillaceae bacterium]|nr:hypothetical protein [Paenibacillaceae bacterium]